ncbi:MAG TPA: T9SS type A sorting domain-containing protein [Ignavibacteria bacterium]|nr:T9SS type A sorting domain-containing protein [Ignavibacteria bacterium]
MKKISVLGLFIIAFICGYFVSEYLHTENMLKGKIKTSGAMEALQLWTAQRAYPDKDIPTDKFYSAFQQKKLRVNKVQTDKKWKAIGPKNFGGRTISIAIDPNNHNTVYAGSAGGGLWRSVTAGVGAEAWEYISTGFPVHGVGAIAINPENSFEIFIGTGEVYNYGNTLGGVAIRETRGSYGIGILKTTDGGETWIKSLDWSYNQQTAVLSLKIDPVNPSIIWAGTSEGTFKSTNSGEDWIQVNDVVMTTDILINPVNTDIVYTACGNLFSPGHGIYRTNDGGDNWEKLASGLPSTFGGKALLDIYKDDPDIIFASIGGGFSSNDPNWLCKTSDGGDTWQIVTTTQYASYQGWFSHFVVINQNNPDELLVAGIDMWKSTNGGNNITRKSDWRAWYFGQTYAGEPEGPPNYSHADHHAFAVHPTDPNIVFLANDGGVFVTEDFGETFEGRNGGYQTLQFYGGFSVAQDDSNFAMGGMQDNATAIYLGEDSWYRVIGGDGGWTAINELDGYIYGSSQYLRIYRSADLFQNSFDYVIPSSNNPSFIAPYVVGYQNPMIMYAASQKIHKSTNGGDTWFNTASNQTISNNRAVSLAVSPYSDDVVFVGYAPVNSPAQIFRTLDGGNNWEDISGDLPDRYPMDIAFDLQNEMNVYVVFSGFGISHAFRSSDIGDTWIDIGDGLPDVPTTTIAVHPYNSKILYVGNDLGIYVSFDQGNTWSEFNTGLPDGVLSMDLSFSTANDVMRLATHGSGVFESKLLNEPITSVNDNDLKNNFSLMQNYPNPFNPSTKIEYNIPSNGYVSLKVFDTLGQTIETLVNEYQSAGNYVVDFSGENFASGIYIYQLRYNHKQLTRKMNFVK